MTRKPMTEEQLRKYAPSSLATNPASTVSDKYQFLPTTIIMEDLSKMGWFPVAANEVAAKKEEYIGYQRHMVKFANMDMGDSISRPEFVILNGHNAKSSLRGLMGHHVWACSNGLISGDILTSMRIVHLEYSAQLMADAIGKILEQAIGMRDDIKKYRTIDMTEVEAGKFAMDAHEMTWKKGSLVDSGSLLMVRRKADNNNSLWSIYNRVQENIIRGSVPYVMHNATHEYIDFTRPVTQLDRQATLNVGLWNLMVQYSKR